MNFLKLFKKAPVTVSGITISSSETPTVMHLKTSTENSPNNITFNEKPDDLGDVVAKGWKATDANMQCRTFQYELNKVYELNKKPTMCDEGFHFCTKFEDIHSFYPLYETTNRVFEIEAYGDVIEASDKTKSVTNKIKFVRELSKDEIDDALGVVIIKDDQGRILSKTCNTSTLFFNRTFAYDADGNEIEKCSYDGQSDLLSKDSTTYVDGVLVSKKLVRYNYHDLFYSSYFKKERESKLFKYIHEEIEYYDNYGKVYRKTIKESNDESLFQLFTDQLIEYKDNIVKSTDYVNKSIEQSTKYPSYHLTEITSLDGELKRRIIQKLTDVNDVNSNVWYNIFDDIILVTWKNSKAHGYIALESKDFTDYDNIDKLEILDKQKISKVILERKFGIDFGLLKDFMTMNYVQVLQKLCTNLSNMIVNNYCDTDYEARFWALGLIEKFGFNIVSVTDKGTNLLKILKDFDIVEIDSKNLLVESKSKFKSKNMVTGCY